MKRLLRRTLSDLTYQTSRFANRTRQGLRILTYHRVTDAHLANRLCVPVARFAEQMHYLRENGYRTVSLAQVANWLNGSDKQQATSNMSFPDKPLVITFDDGFEDDFLYAYPELSRYGFTACFFVPSAFIGSHDGHHPDDRPMSWTQLEELLHTGHEIGAHSVSHRRLSSLTAVEVFWEVRGCKEVLEDRLNHAVDFFCYPSGAYSAFVKKTVKASGYRGACTVEPGANVPGTDPFALKRTEISAFDTLRDFEKKLAGAYDWLHTAVQVTQRWSSHIRRVRQPVTA